MDAFLRDARTNGRTVSEIGADLGLSQNAVTNRCDRLRLTTGVTFRREHRVEQPDERDEAPLPPGHPATWSAISDDVYTP